MRETKNPKTIVKSAPSITAPVIALRLFMQPDHKPPGTCDNSKPHAGWQAVEAHINPIRLAFLLIRELRTFKTPLTETEQRPPPGSRRSRRRTAQQEAARLRRA